MTLVTSLERRRILRATLFFKFALVTALSVWISISTTAATVPGPLAPPEGILDFSQDASRATCYISAGTYENWRPDASSFPAAVLGSGNGWPGEKWLDIRQLTILGPIIGARMDLAVQKGCDAIEPDNIDGYTNTTGFPLTAADQLAYNRFLATAAHQRGLSIGLKNDVDQVTSLVNDFDFAINEQCNEFNECATLAPFIAAGKAVFNAEYSGNTATFCPAMNSMHINGDSAGTSPPTPSRRSPTGCAKAISMSTGAPTLPCGGPPRARGTS